LELVILKEFRQSWSRRDDNLRTFLRTAPRWWVFNSWDQTTSTHQKHYQCFMSWLSRNWLRQFLLNHDNHDHDTRE